MQPSGVQRSTAASHCVKSSSVKSSYAALAALTTRALGFGGREVGVAIITQAKHARRDHEPEEQNPPPPLSYDIILPSTRDAARGTPQRRDSARRGM